ncbi:hypothetical protein CRG98_016965 [Punica granatum]|uniref:Uncharacterized protein n=1 Tax=Punica granatum TaxID=22663 RepID=A0A2I0K2A9_PUNGR|nr:hypothetical protein CRG98_016965 [Punica granatum]
MGSKFVFFTGVTATSLSLTMGVIWALMFSLSAVAAASFSSSCSCSGSMLAIPKNVGADYSEKWSAREPSEGLI